MFHLSAANGQARSNYRRSPDDLSPLRHLYHGARTKWMLPEMRLHQAGRGVLSADAKAGGAAQRNRDSEAQDHTERTTMNHILVVLALLLSGCAEIVLEKSGATPGELDHALYECQVQEQQSANAMNYARDPMSNMAYPFMARQAVLRCLKFKGWTEASPGKASGLP